MGSCCTIRNESEVMDDNTGFKIGLKPHESPSMMSSVETYFKSRNKDITINTDICIIITKKGKLKFNNDRLAPCIVSNSPLNPAQYVMIVMFSVKYLQF